MAGRSGSKAHDGDMPHPNVADMKTHGVYAEGNYNIENTEFINFLQTCNGSYAIQGDPNNPDITPVVMT